jgi:hypothetical protein
MSEYNETPDGTSSWQAIVAWLASCFSFVVNHATQSNIAWGVGVVAGLIAIYSGIMNIRAKRLEIKKLEIELEAEMAEEDAKEDSKNKHKH